VFTLDRRLVVVREVTQEQERQHVVAEIVCVHRATQFVGDVPESFVQFGLIMVGHGLATGAGAGISAGAGAAGNHAGLNGKLRRNSSSTVRKADRIESSIMGLSKITQSPWLFKSRSRF